MAMSSSSSAAAAVVVEGSFAITMEKMRAEEEEIILFYFERFWEAVNSSRTDFLPPRSPVLSRTLLLSMDLVLRI